MVDRVKLGHKLAFLVHTGNLSVFGLELMADAFNVREIQELGRHIEDARAILETGTRAKRMRMVIRKFTGEEEWDDG